MYLYIELLIFLFLAFLLTMSLINHMSKKTERKEESDSKTYKKFLNEYFILLDEVEVPEGYVPYVTPYLQTYFSNFFGSISYGHIVISKGIIGVYVEQELLTVAEIRDSKVHWCKRVPESTKDSIITFIYALEKIMQAKLSDLNKDIYSCGEEVEELNYKGIKVVRTKKEQ